MASVVHEGAVVTLFQLLSYTHAPGIGPLFTNLKEYILINGLVEIVGVECLTGCALLFKEVIWGSNPTPILFSSTHHLLHLQLSPPFEFLVSLTDLQFFYVVTDSAGGIRKCEGAS